MKEKRFQEILELIDQSGEVQSSVLAKRFQVSEVTIRRDLDSLAKAGHIIRTHGGAMARKPRMVSEPPYSNRICQQATAKDQLATKALSLISPTDSVYLDSGTSSLHVASAFPSEASNTIITNGLDIAQELISRSRLSVIMIGGELKSNTLSTRGNGAERQLQEFQVEVAFLGCNAVSSIGQVMIGSTVEVGIKSIARSIGRKIYLLADSSKFNTHSLISYANVADFDGIITDAGLSKETRQSIENLGGTFIIAE